MSVILSRSYFAGRGVMIPSNAGVSYKELQINRCLSSKYEFMVISFVCAVLCHEMGKTRGDVWH
jgi:hypothetical protein